MNAIAMMTLNKTERMLDSSAIAGFVANLGGPVLRPEDQGYDEARALWNAMIDKKPAMIVQASGVADVIESVKFAREHGILLAVRGGGHNISGNALCDGGLVIDLSRLQGIHVDPKARTVWVQPGASWGKVDRETQLFGLAVPNGIVSTTGVAGLTLGGGFGWLSRKYGYTCDNLLEVDLVTADGQWVKANADENPDLFWGVRGGGGNFGVVTSFKYRLQPVGPTVIAGMVVHPMDKAPEVVRYFREFTATAPDELGSLLILRKAPPAPFLPKQIHGQPIVAIAVCYAGSVQDGTRVVQPLKGFGEPVADVIGPKPFITHQTMLDAAQPHGRQYYWKSEYLGKLSDQALDTLVEHGREITSPYSGVLLMQLGGAIGRVAPEETAAGHRDAGYVLNIAASWEDPRQAELHMQWTRDFWTAVQPFSTGGVYMNFLGYDEQDDSRIQAAYGAECYKRLAALKAQYDPDNMFRLNPNIRPAG